jgi:periplasmic protein TonB
MEIAVCGISFLLKHSHMTNNELLKADTLDILFENRNKLYGAYALRRQYDKRMLQALGIMGLLVLLFAGLSAFTGNNHNSNDENSSPDDVKVAIVNMPEKEPEPEKPEPDQPQPRQEKQRKYLDEIKLVKENERVDTMPAQKDIENGNVGTENRDGKEPDGKMKDKPGDGDGGNKDKGEKKPETEKPKEFHPDERGASFPGGIPAFRDFLSRFLQTPGDLEPGEKKVVIVRFKVDTDGHISDIQVVESAGEEYTREVKRVLKKMPAWEPAWQNGIKVAVYFTQPVTFVGQEE